VVTGRHASPAESIGTSGILVAFEGIDGAGKTTQALALYNLLSSAGIPSISTKEPTNGQWGAKIRQSAITGRLPLAEEVHAFLEDRKEHVRDELIPALKKGKVVIVDRYYPSTVAYQGARGMNPAELLGSNSFAPVPDFLFILDVDPKLGLARVASRGDTADLFEKEDELSRARQIFTDSSLWSRQVKDLYILDGTRSQDELAERIAELVFTKLGRPAPKTVPHNLRDAIPDSDAVPSSAGADLS
jgi:dTMP kinase